MLDTAYGRDFFQGAAQGNCVVDLNKTITIHIPASVQVIVYLFRKQVLDHSIRVEEKDKG